MKHPGIRAIAQQLFMDGLCSSAAEDSIGHGAYCEYSSRGWVRRSSASLRVQSRMFPLRLLLLHFTFDLQPPVSFSTAFVRSYAILTKKVPTVRHEPKVVLRFVEKDRREVVEGDLSHDKSPSSLEGRALPISSK